MLELDLLLIPFAENQYPHLSDQEKENFCALLHHPDPVIFAWIMGSEHPEEPALASIIQRIRSQPTELSIQDL